MPNIQTVFPTGTRNTNDKNAITTNSITADVFIYFRDYTKAFDKVRRKDVFELLGRLALLGN